MHVLVKRIDVHVLVKRIGVHVLVKRKNLLPLPVNEPPDHHAHNLATSSTYYAVQLPYRPNIYGYKFSTVTGIKLHGVINNLAFISLKIGPTNAEALVIASKETGLKGNAD